MQPVALCRFSWLKSFWKLTEIGKKSIIERTWLFLCNQFHCAENRQSPSRFFREVGLAYEYLCRERAVHDVITSTLLAAETVITNAACAAAAFVYIRRRHLRPLFSSAKQNIWSVTSILHHCQSCNTWPRLMNINVQSRFSAQLNISFTNNFLFTNIGANVVNCPAIWCDKCILANVSLHKPNIFPLTQLGGFIYISLRYLTRPHICLGNQGRVPERLMISVIGQTP